MTVIRTVLHTDLSLDQVRRRLNSAVDEPGQRLGRRPVRGKVRSHTAGLYQRRPFNNPFRIRMGVIFEPDDENAGDGTTLHCTATIDHWGRVLLTGVTLIYCAVVLTLYIETGSREGLTLAVLWAGALGIGSVYALGRHLSRHEPAFLEAFLIETLDARVVDRPRSR